MINKNKSPAIDMAIIGLGNPGKKYENTRHNIGFRAIDKLSAAHNIKCNKLKFKAIIGDGEIAGARVLLIKPQTYMNLSGECVLEVCNFYKIDNLNILLIYDDIMLDVGKIRIRNKGSDGGQNGVKNIIYHLKTPDIARIKIGVGNKPHRDYDLSQWVLSCFSKGEVPHIEDALQNATDAVLEIIKNGIQSGMNKHNSK